MGVHLGSSQEVYSGRRRQRQRHTVRGIQAIHGKIKECLYFYPSGERPPLAVQSTAWQGAAKGAPKSKQTTAGVYSGHPPYIEMVNKFSNTLQVTDNGQAALHLCRNLWFTISLWPSFAIFQLNVFKTISFGSIHYFSVPFLITGLWTSSNDTILSPFFTT